jgi:hypothetical protein
MKIGTIISHSLKAFIFIMGCWCIYINDWFWSLGCFLVFFITLIPSIVKKNYNVTLPWIMEFLMVFAFSLHIWGKTLKFYHIPYYDKVAHIIASAIVAFFALMIIYILDKYWSGLHMDLPMIAFFIAIFTVAIGALWEIGEFTFDIIFRGKLQHGLQDTMIDLICDLIAGILVAVGGTLAIRKGRLKAVIGELKDNYEKLQKMNRR